VEPSGAPQTQLLDRYTAVPFMQPWIGLQGYFAPPDAASACDTGGDGTESSPQPVAADGWWSDVLCAHGHAAWSGFTMQAARTATLEVTAVDESGLATTAKAMPLIGVWAASDAIGTLPTLAATPSAFNTMALGSTAAGVATTQAEGLRFAIADARGDGRPDFAYRARVLYADSIQPATTSASGGQIVIGGMGFRAGNQVKIDGVPAVVSSWTATAIVAVAPPQSAFGAVPTGPVDVAVVDLATGGSTVMTAALTYADIAPDTMTLLSAPSGAIEVGTTAPALFAVRVFLSDGVTPVASLPVTFSSGTGSVQFGACAAAACVALTDATGTASTTVMPTAFGSVTLEAAAVGAVQTANFQAVARSIAPAQQVEYIAAGATVAWTPQASIVQNGAPAAGVVVNWSGSTGVGLFPSTSLSGPLGVAQTSAIAGPLAAGAQATGQACAWTTICANFAAVGVAPSAWRLTVVSGAGQTVVSPATLAPVVLMVTDPNGDPVAGAAVAVHQTVIAAEMPCPARGPCPVAPILVASQTAAVSDADGLISVAAMQIAGVAEVTNLAVACGTQGFVALSLRQQP
jgi:hypothetical protein